jgi:hypothetical protein
MSALLCTQKAPSRQDGALSLQRMALGWEGKGGGGWTEFWVSVLLAKGGVPLPICLPNTSLPNTLHIPGGGLSTGNPRVEPFQLGPRAGIFLALLFTISST